MSNFFTDNPALEGVLNHPVMQQIIALRERDFADAATCDYAPRHAEEALADYREVMRCMGALCGGPIAENAREVDLQGPQLVAGRVVYARGTQEDHRLLTEAGLYGLTLARRFGGLNMPTTLFVMASEMVARADGSLACLWALQNCAETIAAFGSEEQQNRYLPRIVQGATCSMDLTEPDAGSDLQSATLRAVWSESRGCWLLNGVKRFITNGDADLKLILARTEEGTTDGRGLSLFLHDRSLGGVTVRRLEHKLGIRGSATCELVFEDAPAELIGSRRLGLIRYVMALMNAARLGIGAQAVGLSEAALREAERYAAERCQFGRPIAQIPAVEELLDTMRTRLDASRALLYATARQVDLAYLAPQETPAAEERARSKEAQQLADLYTPLVKLMAGEVCNRIAYDALQIFGGSGYICDFPIERIYRDARVVTIYEGTSQMQVVAASKQVMSGALSRELERMLAQMADDVRFGDEHRNLAALVVRYGELVRWMASQSDHAVAYHARRLVECGAQLLMALCLIAEADTERSIRSARHFTRMAAAQFAAHETMIRSEVQGRTNE